MTRMMTAEQLKPGLRLNFENGWTVDVHHVKDGEVFFRGWLPGEEVVSFPRGLRRMDVETFLAEIEKVGYTYE